MHQFILFVGLGTALCVAAILPRWGTFSAIGWGYSLFAFGIRGVGLSDMFAAIASLRREAREPGAPRPPYAPVIRLTIALGIWALSTAVWSPGPTTSMATSLRWISLAALIPYAYGLAAAGTAPLVRVLFSLSPLVVVEALTVIAFRFNPSLERHYYLSSLSRFLLGSTGRDLYYTVDKANNVIDPERAGGILFVNCNRASMVMGVFLMIYVAVWLWSRRNRLLWPAGLLVIAIGLTGSKTGLALVIVLPIVAIVMARIAEQRDPGMKIILVVASALSLAGGAQYVLGHATGYVAKSQETLVPRFGLWNEAVRAIDSSKLLGLGFGGWDRRWELGQVHLAFSSRPAHNWFLQAWLDGGVVYALLHVALVVAVVKLALRGITQGGTKTQLQIRTFSLAGFMWIVIHGMGDNTALYGDPLTVVPLAIIIAMLSVSTRSSDQATVVAHSRDASTELRADGNSISRRISPRPTVTRGPLAGTGSRRPRA